MNKQDENKLVMMKALVNFLKQNQSVLARFSAYYRNCGQFR